MTDCIYLPMIEREVDGDIYFPEFDESEFKTVYEKRIAGEDPYTYFTFVRK